MFCSVKDKLKELGYTEEDWNFEGLRRCKDYTAEWKILAQQKRELTPRSKYSNFRNHSDFIILYYSVWKTLAPDLIELIKYRKSDLEQKQKEYS